MEPSTRLVSAAFVIVLLLVTIEMGPMAVEGTGFMPSKPVEKRECESPSGKFKGVCLFSNNCKDDCRSEGFNGGHCRGFRRRCMCTKQC